jgi:hypothetical protein
MLFEWLKNSTTLFLFACSAVQQWLPAHVAQLLHRDGTHRQVEQLAMRSICVYMRPTLFN